jgi:hypothetical protein
VRLTARDARKLALFTALSLGDWVLTWLLVGQGPATVYEANPLAGWWLATAGWSGLALFKLLTVLLAGGLCLAIARRSPRAAGRLLSFACAVLAAVVLYSCSLAGYARLEAAAAAAECSRLRERDQHLDRRLSASAEYRESLHLLSASLIARDCTLAGAVRELRRTAMARDPSWLGRLRQDYPGCSDEQCLALNLSRYTVLGCCRWPSPAREVAERLDAELRGAYGVSLSPTGSSPLPTGEASGTPSLGAGASP